MIKRFLFYVVGLLLTGSGTWIAKTCQSNKEIYSLNQGILSLNQTIILKNDTLGVVRDSVFVLKADVGKLKQADSSNRFFIGEKEKVLIEQRNIIRSLGAENKALLAWKTDAQDGIIIQLDTIRVRKKGIFGLGKGYKVIK